MFHRSLMAYISNRNFNTIDYILMTNIFLIRTQIPFNKKVTLIIIAIKTFPTHHILLYYNVKIH